MKLRLVANWRAAWKWLSMQLIAAAAVWEGIPDDVKLAVVSIENHGRVTFWLLIGAAVGRVIDQGTATSQEPQE